MFNPLPVSIRSVAELLTDLAKFVAGAGLTLTNPKAVLLMTTSSFAVGTASLDQLAGVFQSDPVPVGPPSHVTVAKSRRVSRRSTIGACGALGAHSFVALPDPLGNERDGTRARCTSASLV
jgi:hypothetical protein